MGNQYWISESIVAILFGLFSILCPASGKAILITGLEWYYVQLYISLTNRVPATTTKKKKKEKYVDSLVAAGEPYASWRDFEN